MFDDSMYDGTLGANDAVLAFSCLLFQKMTHSIILKGVSILYLLLCCITSLLLLKLPVN